MYYTPIIWDNIFFAFVPFKTTKKEFPIYPKDKCSQICAELNKIAKLCTYKPKLGEIYYHPVTYVPELSKFVVMDNQAVFNNCPYPACADLENCQKICDLMNRVLESFNYI